MGTGKHTGTGHKGLTAVEQAFHDWYYAEGLLGLVRAREAAPDSDGWDYAQLTAFNRQWTAEAWKTKQTALV